MDGWKSRTCPLEASRVKACHAGVRSKLSKRNNEIRELLGREWMVVGTGGLQGKFMQFSAYEGPVLGNMRPEGRVQDHREWWGLCQTGSSVPLPEGPQLSSGLVDCDHEGILAQYHQIFPFLKKSMES